MAEFIDLWHAECLPCKWCELCETQQDAIEAVEEHLKSCPLHLSPEQRGGLHAGHVQCRTVGAPEFAWDWPKPDTAIRLPHFPGDGAANLPVTTEAPRDATGTKESEVT